MMSRARGGERKEREGKGKERKGGEGREGEVTRGHEDCDEK